MCKFLVLCGALFCLSLTAAAQDSTAALDATSPASDPAAPAALYPSNRQPWQLEAGFQYQHFQVVAPGFHNLGFNSGITRYLNDWIGVEAAVVMGFGHTGISASVPRSLDAKSLFVGGGPRVVWSNSSKFEPWVHGLVGLEHFRFTQTNNTIGLGSNSALGFEAGGGVDYKLGAGLSWRIQGDFVGSRFNSMIQKNYSAGSGIVFNF